MQRGKALSGNSAWSGFKPPRLKKKVYFLKSEAGWSFFLSICAVCKFSYPPVFLFVNQPKLLSTFYKSSGYRKCDVFTEINSQAEIKHTSSFEGTTGRHAGGHIFVLVSQPHASLHEEVRKSQSSVFALTLPVSV